MSPKSLVFLGMIVGSAIGGYLPILFGADLLSFISVLTSGIGGILGIWAGYQLSKSL